MTREKIKKKSIYKYIILALIAIVSAFPVIYMAANSFMGEAEINSAYNIIAGSGERKFLSFKLIPQAFTLIQYYTVLLREPDFLLKFWNSVLLVVPIVAGQIIISAPAAYVFAKLKFPFRDQIYFILIVLMLMPYQVTVVPNFLVLNKFHLIGSNAAIILPGVFSAFGVFLLTQFMKAIPNEQIEAAKMDGAGYIKVFVHIVLPQSKGAIASLAILSFVDNWNMVEQPIVFLQNSSKYPLSVFLSQINSGDLGIAFVCGILYMLPAVLFFLRKEEDLLEGIKYVEIK